MSQQQDKIYTQEQVDSIMSDLKTILLPQIRSAIEGRVKKVSGKGLSTNDYTDAEKTKLAALTNAINALQNQINALEALPTPVEVVEGATVSSQVLAPNTFYSFSGDSTNHVVTSLTFTLGNPTSGVTNEYNFEFDSGSTAATVSFPASIVWQDGTPSIAANTHYEVSIKYDAATGTYYGLIAEWSNA